MRYNIPMADKNLVKNTFSDALEEAVKLLAACRKARAEAGENPLERRRILFVPDKYTLLAEKLLCGVGASFDGSVLTFNRLSQRLAEYEGSFAEGRPLSRLGAVLTLRKILSECEDKLLCYNKSVGFAGFGETVYDNICQFAASGISADDLPDTDCTRGEGILEYKLHDLKLLYTEYEKAMRGKYVDSSGRLLYLDKLLSGDTDYFDDCDVYFAGFDDFTPLQARIAEKICDKVRGAGGEALVISAECKLCVNCPVEFYAAPTFSDELKATAARLRAYAERGIRYGEMGVVADTADYNRLKRIFDEYGIPFYTDVKYALSSHPLARYLLDLFEGAENPSSDVYIRLAKNPYSQVGIDESDVFENYINYCAVPKWAMGQTFTAEPKAEGYEGARETAEKVRRTVSARIAKIKKSEINCGADFLAALRGAIPECESEISARINSPLPDACEKIAETATTLSEIFGQAKFSDMRAALEEGLSLCSFSTLPSKSDTVQVGDVSLFRVGKYKRLFVLGCHDGEMPRVMRDDGLLSDGELDNLRERGVKVEPKVEELNRRAREELCSVLSSCEGIFMSYRTDCAPSRIMDEIADSLRAHGRKEDINSRDEERAKLYMAGAKLSGGERLTQGEKKLVCGLCPSREAARELALIGRCEIAAGLCGSGLEPELEAVAPTLSPPETDSQVKNAKKLYSARGISISRVQDYFACPRRAIMRHGFRLTPKPDGSVSVLDLGTFLHRVIELYIYDCKERGDYTPHPERVREALKRAQDEEPLYLKGMSDDMRAELEQEAVEVSAVVASQIAQGGFRPLYFEKAFGFRDSEFKGLPVKLSDGTLLSLNGYIDRLDVTPSGAARVIDYKTGFTEFSFADIYYGRKVQLAVYLAIAKLNGFTPAGMFYFPFSSGFARDEFTYRLQGVFDSDYALEMDKNLGESERASEVVAAASTSRSAPDAVVLNKARSGSALSSDELNAVCDYAVEVFRTGAEEMISGSCAGAPLRAGTHTECTYCEMKPVCNSLGGKSRERNKRSVSKDFIAACMQREEK